MWFTADSDAIITKGIIALLIRVLNGRTPREILDTELYFIDAIGLSANLSPTRSNGLLAMVKQMRLYALAFAPANTNSTGSPMRGSFPSSNSHIRHDTRRDSQG